jgi:hypothetical protein
MTIDLQPKSAVFHIFCKRNQRVNHKFPICQQRDGLVDETADLAKMFGKCARLAARFPFFHDGPKIAPADVILSRVCSPHCRAPRSRSPLPMMQPILSASREELPPITQC